MNITFIVPELNLTGGLRVVSIYAEYLAQYGHKVTVVSPGKKPPNLKQKIKSVLNWKGYKFRSGFDSIFFENSHYDVKVLNKHRPVRSADVPDADIVIATFWNTAEWIAEFPEIKGKKVYFIQHHEIHIGPIERVEATYRLPFYKVTIANWLVSLMEKEYASANAYLVPNSVDHETFYADARTKQAVPTIGFLFSETAFKGVDVALNVIQNLKKQIPELRVLAFGHSTPDVMNLPDYIEFSLNPEQYEIRMLYQQCDLWLCCSTFEGFGLTILEAMACRTPAISTKCGGPEDIITENVNGYLCDVNDVNALTDAAYKMLSFKDNEWQNFSDQAYKFAKQYTWDEAAKSFENALLQTSS